MKKLIKSDPITAAARTQIGVIPVFALCSVGVLAGITLFLMLLTDWSFAMPYYHLDSTAKLAAFEAGRGKSGLMASDGLETWGDTIAVTTNSTNLISFGGAVAPVGSTSYDTEYQMYYRYMEDEDGGALAALACPLGKTPPAKGYVDVHKFDRDLTESFLRKAQSDGLSGVDVYFYKIEPHTQPIWLKYVIYLAFVAAALLWILILPGFTWVQKHTAIGRRIGQFGAFEELKPRILADWQNPLYASFTQFVGRHYLMLNDRSGPFHSVRWYFYPLSRLAQVNMTPDPADPERCFRLVLTMDDGHRFAVYQYTDAATAKQVEGILCTLGGAAAR